MVRKNTSLTVDPKLWHDFKVRVAEIDMKLHEALDEALGDWIAKHEKEMKE